MLQKEWWQNRDLKEATARTGKSLMPVLSLLKERNSGIKLIYGKRLNDIQ